MQATIVDLRYRMREVLEALSRNEDVTVLYYGKKIAKLISIQKCSDQKKKSPKKHPFLGMLSQESTSVAEQMAKLRGGRYRDI
jgi:antitoxin (DNA-binding transcriptional repressor) of toxin-antitoxin stability system